MELLIIGSVALVTMTLIVLLLMRRRKPYIPADMYEYGVTHQGDSVNWGGNGYIDTPIEEYDPFEDDRIIVAKYRRKVRPIEQEWNYAERNTGRYSSIN